MIYEYVYSSLKHRHFTSWFFGFFPFDFDISRIALTSSALVKVNNPKSKGIHQFIKGLNNFRKYISFIISTTEKLLVTISYRGL